MLADIAVDVADRKDVSEIFENWIYENDDAVDFVVGIVVDTAVMLDEAVSYTSANNDDIVNEGVL